MLHLGQSADPKLMSPSRLCIAMNHPSPHRLRHSRAATVSTYRVELSRLPAEYFSVRRFRPMFTAI
jgi:hypothetical protein